jgi:hypothetical protein
MEVNFQYEKCYGGIGVELLIPFLTWLSQNCVSGHRKIEETENVYCNLWSEVL